jgi:hypothetical protein
MPRRGAGQDDVDPRVADAAGAGLDGKPDEEHDEHPEQVGTEPAAAGVTEHEIHGLRRIRDEQQVVGVFERVDGDEDCRDGKADDGEEEVEHLHRGTPRIALAIDTAHRLTMRPSFHFRREYAFDDLKREPCRDGGRSPAHLDRDFHRFEYFTH